MKIYIQPVISILFILIIQLGLLSCAKEGTFDHETNITILQPGDGDVFSRGQEIRFSAEVESSVSVHGYEIFEKNRNDGTSRLITARHTHGNKIQAEYTWTTDFTDPGEREIEMHVLVNHEGVKEIRSRKIVFR